MHPAQRDIPKSQKKLEIRRNNIRIMKTIMMRMMIFSHLSTLLLSANIVTRGNTLREHLQKF